MNTFNDSNPIHQWFALSLRDENSPKNKKIYSSTNERIDLFSNTEKITEYLSSSNPSDKEAVSICQTIFKEFEEYSSEKFDIPAKWAARYSRHGESTKNDYVGAYEIFHRLFQKIEGREDLYDTQDPHVRNALSKMKEIDQEILKFVNEPENELPTQGNKLPTQGIAKVSPGVRHAIFSKLVERGPRGFSKESFKALFALSQTSKEVRNQVKAEFVYLLNQGKITPKNIGIKSLKMLDQFFGAKDKQKLERLEWTYLSQKDIEGFDWQSFPNLKEVCLNYPQNLSCLIYIGEKLEKLELRSLNVLDLEPLKNCVNLKYLDLSFAEIKNLSFLTSIGKKLEKLELRGLNVLDLEPLNNCVNLKYLDLSYAKIKNLSFLTSIGKKLETLVLNGLKEVDDLEAIEHCTELKDLNLEKVNLKNVSFLNGLKKLQKLDLSHTPSFDPTPLKHCVNLKYLKLVRAKITNLNFLESDKKNLEDKESISRNLEEIDLQFCSFITDYAPLKYCMNLKILNFHDSTINNLSFLKFCGEKLQILNLSGCNQLNDFSSIKHCTNLKELKLQQRMGLSKVIIDLSFLQGAGKNLKKLDLQNCQLNNFSAFENCIYLRDLDLSNSNVNDVSALKACSKNLQILDLADCKQLKDFSPLKHLINLKKLDLSQSSVEDLNFLAGSGKTLQKLTLRWCINLKDCTPIEFCTDIKILDLTNTNIDDLNFLKTNGKTLQGLDILFCNIKNGDHPGNYLPVNNFRFSKK